MADIDTKNTRIDNKRVLSLKKVLLLHTYIYLYLYYEFNTIDPLYCNKVYSNSEAIILLFSNLQLSNRIVPRINCIRRQSLGFLTSPLMRLENGPYTTITACGDRRVQ